MKIIHSIATLDMSAGGPSRSLPNICIGLNRKGVEQQIITFNSKNPNTHQLIEDNIDILFVEKKQKFALDFREVIKCLDGDVFHLHNLWSPSLHWTASMCRKKNIPYIISPRGTLEPWPLSQKWLKKRLSWLLYQKKDLMNASCIHATSKEEAKNIRSLGITTPIAIIPNGINVKNYPYLKTRAVEENKTILFLSRISPKKGIETLINAWISIPKEDKKNWRIRIVGEGDKGVHTNYTAKIKQIINDKNLTETVKVVGPKYGEDKINEYKNANLFVLPTYSENFGMVIAEAMVSGVPVITTKGTPWQVLNKKKLGWWIENTEYDLKEALIEAMSLDEDTRIEMGLKSRQYIIDNYSMEQVTSKYQLLYRDVLDKSIGNSDLMYV